MISHKITIDRQAFSFLFDLTQSRVNFKIKFHRFDVSTSFVDKKEIKCLGKLNFHVQILNIPKIGSPNLRKFSEL